MPSPFATVELLALEVVITLAEQTLAAQADGDTEDTRHARAALADVKSAANRAWGAISPHDQIVECDTCGAQLAGVVAIVHEPDGSHLAVTYDHDEGEPVDPELHSSEER